MRRLVYILLLMVVAGTVGCHRTPSDVERQLIDIDSLIGSTESSVSYGRGCSPADSALKLLAALSPSPDSQPADTSEPSESSGTSGNSVDSSPSKLEGARGSVSATDEASAGSVSATDEASPGSVSASKGTSPGGITKGKVTSPVPMTEAERAYHALLTAQAMWKAYIPATTDSVIRCAWQYYEHNGAYDRRIRAMLYMGTTAEELGHPEEAMRWYKRTELEAAPDDHYHRGYALMSMAYIYQNVAFSSYDAKNAYYNAVKEFSHKSCFDTTNYLFCLSQLGLVYNRIDIDSSIVKLKQALQQSRNLRNKLYISDNLISLASCYFIKKDFKNAIDFAKDGIRYDGISFKQEFIGCYIVAMSYALSGQRDSAEFYYSKMPMPKNALDSSSVIGIQSKFEEMRGNFNNHLVLEKKKDSILSTQLQRAHNNNFKLVEEEITKKYYLRQTKKHSQTNRVLISLLLACVFIIVSLFLIQKKIYIQRLINLEKEYNAVVSNINQLSAKSEYKRKAYFEQQKCIRNFFDIIMHAAPRKTSSIKSDLKKIILSDSQWEELCNSLNVILDGFVTDLTEKYNCTQNEVRVFCICYCGGSNNMVELCLPYKKQSIANLKQQIAHKVLGNNSTWNDLINTISS